MAKNESNAIEDPSNRSRHLEDISFEQSVSGVPATFAFSKEVPLRLAASDDSFEKLKNMVLQPRPKPLGDFFKELEVEDQEGLNDSFLKREMYTNRQEFEQYLKNLKLEKRAREEQHMRQQEDAQGKGMAKKVSGFGIDDFLEFEDLPKSGNTFGMASDIQEKRKSTEMQNSFKNESANNSKVIGSGQFMPAAATNKSIPN